VHEWFLRRMQARAKFDKVIAQRNAADTGYQEGVRLLDGVRVDWERTLEATAQVWKGLFGERIGCGTTRHIVNGLNAFCD
jgi:hypothetical protein